MKAKLVEKLEDWEYSSFRDYLDLRKNSLCNKELAIEVIDLNMKQFYEEYYPVINFEIEMK